MDVENGEDLVNLKAKLSIEIKDKIKLVYIYNNQHVKGMNRAIKIRS